MLVFDIREDWVSDPMNARCGEQEAIDQQRLVHMPRHPGHLVGLPTTGAEDLAARRGKRPHVGFCPVGLVDPTVLVFEKEQQHEVKGVSLTPKIAGPPPWA